MTEKELEVDSLITELECSVEKLKVIMEDINEYFSQVVNGKYSQASILLNNYERMGVKSAILSDMLFDVDRQLKMLETRLNLNE